MVKSCWICKTSGNTQNKSYYRIPKILYHRNAEITQLSALRKEKWHKILSLPYETSGIRICSNHFVSGTPSKLLDVNDPDWIPSQNLILNTEKNFVESQQTKKYGKANLQVEFCKCRLCMQSVKQELCTDIFHTRNKKVLKMVSMVLGHDVLPDEKISKFGCHTCLKKVQLCHKLLTYFRSKEKYYRVTFPEEEEEKEANGNFNIQVSNPVNVENIPDTLHKNKNESCLSQVGKSFSDREKIDENIRNDICPVPYESCNDKNLSQDVKDCVLGENLYDKELILSIIENRSFSSDEESDENRTVVKYEKRKYDVQAVKIKSSEMKTLKCSNCYKKFINLNDLKMHKNFCKLFYCQLCKPQILFKDKNDQLLHKKKYHSHSLVCHICGKNYSQTYLLKHFKNHFEHKRKCPCCNKILKNSTILMSHIDNVHGEKLSGVCEFCGGCFRNIKKHFISCKFTQD